ncbi:2-oxo acid dehydrogenase subunit E2 [Marinobacter lacisalsi]|uniref:Dihydrolipoamide acetyltransferase component of pyruvate dehydrogenase complex n=1 Tax=Marinobacter lacisalsi TaxID=475979 RepID=A0ABV8QK18_9GAMM
MSAIEMNVPDLGGPGEAEVIELCVEPGQMLSVDDSVVVVESDKATIEIPASGAGKVQSLNVSVGDQVKTGDLMLMLEPAEGEVSEKNDSDGGQQSNAQSALPETGQPTVSMPEPAPEPPARSEPARSGHELPGSPAKESMVYAGPAVRKLARELGVPLDKVTGSGPRGRLLKDDLEAFVRAQMEKAERVAGTLPEVKLPDFAAFGPVERAPMSRLHQATAKSMHRSWLNVPHVTQFDHADITALESFRKAQKSEAERKGLKLTLVPFLLKAIAYALRAYPQFNVSLDIERNELVYKHYVHIGVAVDTPEGLMVPVVRDVDCKNLWALAEELTELATLARDRKLKPDQMQGGCFTLSSLGGIGGSGFTPIVNTPEVGILGVSRSDWQPRFNGESFEPRQMLPLSLSYDHRAVNGADAARFTTLVGKLLGDVRRMLL